MTESPPVGRQPTLAETYVLLNPEGADGTRALCLLLADWVAQGWLDLKPTRVLHRPGEIWSGGSVRGVDVATLSPRLIPYARRYSAPRLVMEGIRSAGPLGRPFSLRSAAFYWRERLGRDHGAMVVEGLFPDLEEAGYLEQVRERRRFPWLSAETAWRHTARAEATVRDWRNRVEAARLTVADIRRDPEDLESIALVAQASGAAILFLPDVTPRDCRIAIKALRARSSGGKAMVPLSLATWERYGKRLENAVTNISDGSTMLGYTVPGAGH